MKKAHKMSIYVFISAVVLVLFTALIGIYFGSSKSLDITRNAKRVSMEGVTTTYTNTSIDFVANKKGQTLSSIQVNVDDISCVINKAIHLDDNNDFVRCDDSDNTGSEIYLYVESNLKFIAIYDKSNKIVFLDNRGFQNQEFSVRIPLMLQP